MPTIKFSLSDKDYETVRLAAEQQGVSIQDYVRGRLLDINTIFTPAEALKRAKEKFAPGTVFTLPDVYGDEWSLKRGYAGVFGKQFYNYVLKTDGISFVGMTADERHAQYKII